MRKWRDKILAESVSQHEGLDIKQIVEENKRLRKALKQAELEREILKKATVDSSDQRNIGFNYM